MQSVIQRPSAVGYVLTSGLYGRSRDIQGISSNPAAREPVIDICIAHIAVASSAPSTTLPSPVCARFTSAAATPPASAMPLSASPNAPAGKPTGSAPGGAAADAAPLRDQNVIESYPPLFASGPRAPWPVPVA